MNSAGTYKTPFLILIYGAILALLVFLLKWWNYRFFVHQVGLELYIFAIALFFTVLGIWAGLRLTRGEETSHQHRLSLNQQALQQYQLSQREQQVLALMCEGLSNKEIAEKLFISTNTVKTHSSKLYSKLNVSSRTRAVAMAQQHLLLNQHQPASQD